MVRWHVHGERTLYSSPWVSLALTTAEPPGVEPFEHHVIRAPGPAAGAIITRQATGPDSRVGQEVLLLHRHRFITDTWGWEIPAGGVDAGESPASAAAREALEETGWRPLGDPEPVTVFHPSNGLSDQTFHIFAFEGAERIAEPTDPSEAGEVRWWPVGDVVDLIGDGQITDGLSLTALSVALTLGTLTP